VIEISWEGVVLIIFSTYRISYDQVQIIVHRLVQNLWTSNRTPVCQTVTWACGDGRAVRGSKNLILDIKWRFFSFLLNFLHAISLHWRLVEDGSGWQLYLVILWNRYQKFSIPLCLPALTLYILWWSIHLCNYWIQYSCTWVVNNHSSSQHKNV